MPVNYFYFICKGFEIVEAFNRLETMFKSYNTYQAANIQWVTIEYYNNIPYSMTISKLYLYICQYIYALNFIVFRIDGFEIKNPLNE